MVQIVRYRLTSFKTGHSLALRRVRIRSARCQRDDVTGLTPMQASSRATDPYTRWASSAVSKFRGREWHSYRPVMTKHHLNDGAIFRYFVRPPALPVRVL